MQLMIDSADGAEKLRLAARFLEQLAMIGDDVAPIMGKESTAGGIGRAVPAPMPTLADVGLPDFKPMPVGRMVEDDDGAPATMPPAAVVFAKMPPPPPETVTQVAVPLYAPPPPPAPPVQASLGAAMGTPVPVEYDSTGLPYDPRIHQAGKSKKKNGEWKVKKGLEDAFVQSVVRELSVAHGVVVAPAPPAPPVPPAPAAPAAQVPLPPSAPAAVPAPAGPGGEEFKLLMRRVVALTGRKALGEKTQDAINAVIRSVGAPSLQSLAVSMGALIPDVNAALDIAEATAAGIS